MKTPTFISFLNWNTSQFKKLDIDTAILSESRGTALALLDKVEQLAEPENFSILLGIDESRSLWLKPQNLPDELFQ
jgi:hypothetical protein